MFSLTQRKSCSGAKIWSVTAPLKLAFAASLFMVPPITPHGLFPCEVAKKWCSALRLKSCSWYIQQVNQRLIKNLILLILGFLRQIVGITNEIKQWTAVCNIITVTFKLTIIIIVVHCKGMKCSLLILSKRSFLLHLEQENYNFPKYPSKWCKFHCPVLPWVPVCYLLHLYEVVMK